ncbi:MAG TPA: hypothetical protein VK044_01390 [Virgibacillus sp.]|nr:hypothetical protein [Virgibacillus sp.]
MHTKKWVVIIISIILMATISACKTEKEKDSIESNEEEEPSVTEDDDKSEVVTIEDKIFLYEDLEFYKLMNQIQVDINLEEERSTIDEENIEERAEFWNEQLEYYENVNVNLQSLIETYAMSLLAEEKNFFVPDEKIETEVDKLLKQIENNESIRRRIDDYGEKRYNRNIREYVRQTKLRDRIISELEADIIEENGDLEENEISYLVETEFEDLYAAQLSTLDMNIHIQ